MDGAPVLPLAGLNLSRRMLSLLLRGSFSPGERPTPLLRWWGRGCWLKVLRMNLGSADRQRRCVHVGGTCELSTQPSDSLRRWQRWSWGIPGPHLPAILLPQELPTFLGLCLAPCMLPASCQPRLLLTLSEADQRPLRQQSMGLELTLPYLRGKGNGPCTISRDWRRCLGPCAVHQLPFYSFSRPPGHQPLVF